MKVQTIRFLLLSHAGFHAETAPSRIAIERLCQILGKWDDSPIEELSLLLEQVAGEPNAPAKEKTTRKKKPADPVKVKRALDAYHHLESEVTSRSLTPEKVAEAVSTLLEDLESPELRELSQRLGCTSVSLPGLKRVLTDQVCEQIRVDGFGPAVKPSFPDASRDVGVESETDSEP